MNFVLKRKPIEIPKKIRRTGLVGPSNFLLGY